MLSEIQEDKLRSSPLVWMNIESDLLGAINFSVESAQYHESLAYLYGIRGVMFLKYAEIASPNFHKSMNSYKLALKKRPMSGSVLANLALLNYYLNNKNQIGILEDGANRYGKNDPKTQKVLFYLDLKRWSDIPEVKREEIRTKYFSASGQLKVDMANIQRQFQNLSMFDY